MAQYLDKAGLTTLWTKIKNTFALKSHTHTKSQIKDFPTIPTVNNPTITINQGGTKKGSFTLNQSGAATIDLTDNDTTYSTATQSANGLMSSSDKKKLDGIAEGANKITVDSALSSTSTNPVQNKVIKSALDGKAGSSHSHSSLTNSSGRVFNVPTGGSGGEQKTLVITDDLNAYQPAGNYASSTHKHPISDINNLQSTIDGIYSDMGLQDEAIAGKSDIGHTHTKSQITDFPTIPTVNNPTITINQGGTKKGSFTLNQSGSTTIELTDNDTNTWRGIQNNLTSDSTTDSLSAAQGKALANGSARDSTKLPLTGGTMTGNLSLKEYKNILLRPNNSSYTSGIGYDTQGNECIALWAKNSVTRLRWNAGVDMSELTSGKMMDITPDFEISKADGTAKGYIAGQQIIDSGNIGSQSVNYANSAGSVAWGNVTGKPSTYTPSAHEHTSLKSNTDNRNTNTKPNDYNGILNIAGLKGNDKIGLDTNIYGTYSCLIGVRGWSDSSGGNAHELAFTGNGHIVHRHGSTTSWGSWNRIAHVSDIPTKLPASNISMSSDGTTLTITYS